MLNMSPNARQRRAIAAKATLSNDNEAGGGIDSADCSNINVPVH